MQFSTIRPASHKAFPLGGLHKAHGQQFNSVGAQHWRTMWKPSALILGFSAATRHHRRFRIGRALFVQDLELTQKTGAPTAGKASALGWRRRGMKKKSPRRSIAAGSWRANSGWYQHCLLRTSALTRTGGARSLDERRHVERCFVGGRPGTVHPKFRQLPVRAYYETDVLADDIGRCERRLNYALKRPSRVRP